LSLDYRGENTRRGILVEAEASQFDAFRFNGFGNQAPELSRDASLVMMDRVRLYPALVWHLGPRPGAPADDEEAEGNADPDAPKAQDAEPADAEAAEGEGEEDEPEPEAAFVPVEQRLSGRITIGPVVQWTDPRFPEGNPLTESALSEGFGQAGMQLGFEILDTDRPAAPRRGYAAALTAAAYPALWDVADAYGTVTGTAAAYVPVVAGTHLALRAGGTHVIGDAFPVWDAAFIGGRTSLRGFRYHRFAGESAAFGSVELRVPIDTVQIFFNGELGIFALSDAGRVWQDEVSEGEWHTSKGLGLWFATMNRSVSLTYARGDRDGWYLWFGLPF
jgi:hypothetical protein